MLRAIVDRAMLFKLTWVSLKNTVCVQSVEHSLVGNRYATHLNSSAPLPVPVPAHHKNECRGRMYHLVASNKDCVDAVVANLSAT